MPLYLNSPGSGSPTGLLSRILAAIVAAVLLALFLVFGFAIFLVLLVVALIGGIIFSWRFRKVRREMESVMREAEKSATPYPGTGSTHTHGPTSTDNSNGETIEGEFKVINRED